MQATAGESTGPNWTLGARALLMAMALVGVANATGSTLPFGGAILIAGWTALGPLKFGAFVRSRRVQSWCGWMAVRAFGLLLSATALGLAVNSSIAALSIAGNVMFMCLVIAVAGITAWHAWRLASEMAPRAWSRGSESASHALAQAMAVWQTVYQR